MAIKTPLTETPGQVITFYSYKGGTGRTMALANVACLLAKQVKGKGVLIVDWDLEAPGLHRFFQDRFEKQFAKSDDIDSALDEQPGLIDLFGELDKAIPPPSLTEVQTEEDASAVLDSVKFEQFILETDIPSLHLLKAGRFDEKYAYRVNTFQWEDFYNRSPSLIRLFAERLTERYQYVLIDSRTGVTDISGICTMLMPRKLVVVFTPNRQSLTGSLDLIRQATNYRRQSDDLRPLAVFPLPSRIENAEPTLREDWRYGSSERKIVGYQSLFEPLFKETYNLPECDLENYFNEVQIQHIPRYAYGEEIAVLVERSGDRLSLTRSYESFTERLVNLAGPWESLSRARSKVNPRLQRKIEIGDFDVFLCHNSVDKPAVKQIGKQLKERGILPWLDEWNLIPGRAWQHALEEQIERIKSAAVFVGKEGIGPWYQAELEALLREFVNRGCPVIPVLLPDAPQKQELPIFLEGMAWVDFRKEEPNPIEQLIWCITGERPC